MIIIIIITIIIILVKMGKIIYESPDLIWKN